MISDVSGKLIGQFADCLAGELAAPSAPAEPPAPAEPDLGVAGIEPVAAPDPGVADTEPVDLLALAGSSAAVRRATGIGLGALIVLVIVWVVFRRRG
jgi:hypothetical protein